MRLLAQCPILVGPSKAGNAYHFLLGLALHKLQEMGFNTRVKNLQSVSG